MKCCGKSCNKYFDKCDGDILADNWYCSSICYQDAVNKAMKENETNTKENKINKESYELESKVTNTKNANKISSNDDELDDEYDPMLDF